MANTTKPGKMAFNVSVPARQKHIHAPRRGAWYDLALVWLAFVVFFAFFVVLAIYLLKTY